MTTQRESSLPNHMPDHFIDNGDGADGAGTNYEVGYGKPPKHSQFRKGQSGNPAGRRKGRANLGTILGNVLHATVQVSERGRRVTKSKLEIALTQVANKAAAGDLKAIAMLTRLAQFADETAQTDEQTRLGADQRVTREMARALGARMVQDLAQVAPDSSPRAEVDQAHADHGGSHGAD